MADGLFVPGSDYVYGLIELEVPASESWNISNFSAQILFTGVTDTYGAMTTNSSERTGLPAHRKPSGRLVLQTPTGIVPAAATRAALQLFVYGSGTIDVFRASLVRVTQAEIDLYGREWAGLPPA